MEAQRQANGMTVATAQPLSPHVSSHGIAGERLTNGVRCASLVGMKTRPNAGSVSAGVAQPRSYDFVSQAGALIRLAEQRHKAGVATLDSMTATKDTATATRSTLGICSQRSHMVRSATKHQISPRKVAHILDSQRRR